MTQDFDIRDDLNVSDTNYPEQETGFRPPLPGTYRVKPLTWKFATNAAGDVVKWKNSAGEPTYPVINLDIAELTEPIEFTRKVGLFQQVPTFVFDREGKGASAAADLLRSIDRTITANNTGEVIR